MKVVLFCGGLGTRLREYSDTIPKPMVNIGHRPILWHVMKYYAYYGHKDFILCLGHRGDLIRQYFLNYDECISNDFVLSKGGRDVELYSRDIDDWRITFVDTGLQSNIGQRLRAVEKYLVGEPWFLANYSDGLSDLPLPEYLAYAQKRDRIGTFLCVRPNQSFHVVSMDPSGLVSDIQSSRESQFLVNGGFFAFKSEIFDYIGADEELVEEPFRRLIDKGELAAYRYDGFWGAMDTLKDKQRFDDMETQGETPWAVWKTEEISRPSAGRPANQPPRRRSFPRSV
ncbi:MAG TPA: sugar phosphate nucleotidyltransferase [Candidatus Limnocylindrales bacterium]|jgi:glucose-1-phosphate cytidylyltransferase|nr:sugar phosphate nucleotidyltransferase [Candidatus Limnocylindrales bacterium]